MISVTLSSNGIDHGAAIAIARAVCLRIFKGREFNANPSGRIAPTNSGKINRISKAISLVFVKIRHQFSPSMILQYSVDYPMQEKLSHYRTGVENASS
jgi:hypothetical protein